MTTRFGPCPLSSLLDRNPLLEELGADASFPSNQHSTTFSPGLSKKLYLNVITHSRLFVICFDITHTHTRGYCVISF